MPHAEARVETDRAGRYLIQLCRHAGQMGRHTNHLPRLHPSGERPPQMQQVDWSDTEGVIAFDGGRCTLRADAATLTVRAEAADLESLQRIQTLVGNRLETIGRRDNLRVRWQPVQDVSSEPATIAAARLTRARRNTILLAVGVVLAIGVHVTGGTLPANARWAADGFLAIVTLKLLAVAVIARRHRARRSRT